TVRFADGVRTLLADPSRVLLEVGPGKSLASLVRQQPAAARARGVFSSMRHAEEQLSDVVQLMTALGRLWSAGVELDPALLWRGERRRRVTLPAYPFQRRRYWIEPGKPSEPAAADAS